ncbi:MAG: hypothetical protein ACI9TV_003096 [Sulfurimonas sp.]|jgi:hypothetical protein|uniref:hypothetical protein n=1 Tax=Sulfurimonas sp. TaxID=2022749 RepID=UPI0039E3190C
MKFIFMLFMLSSLLFSGQTQIILGSYSVQANGERALETVNKQIQKDIQLQDFMKDNSLRTINTVISDYTVVSINAFDSYRDLLNTINVFKVYYGDAFVLKYPTKNIKDAQSIEEIEEKAKVEQIIEDTAHEEKELKSEIVEVESTINDEPELVQTEDKNEILIQEPAQETPVEQDTAYKEESISEPVQIEKEEKSQIEEYIIYLVALAALALLAAGITVFKIANSNTKKQADND